MTETTGPLTRDALDYSRRTRPPHYARFLYAPEDWQHVRRKRPIPLLLPTKHEFVHQDAQTLLTWSQRRHRLLRPDHRLQPVTRKRVLLVFVVPGDFVLIGWRTSFSCAQAVLLLVGSAALVVSGFAGVLLGVLASLPLRVFLVNLPAVVGTAAFVVANYCFLLAVINTSALVREGVPVTPSPIVFTPVDTTPDAAAAKVEFVNTTASRCPRPRLRWLAFYPRRLDYVAAVLGVLATVLLNISTILAVVANEAAWFEAASTTSTRYAVFVLFRVPNKDDRIPGLVGSLLLVLSFYFQWVENQHHLLKWDPHRMTWWELVILTAAAVLLVVANALGIAGDARSTPLVQYGANVVFLVAFWFLLAGSYLFYVETIN